MTSVLASETNHVMSHAAGADLRCVSHESPPCFYSIVADHPRFASSGTRSVAIREVFRPCVMF